MNATRSARKFDWELPIVADIPGCVEAQTVATTPAVSKRVSFTCNLEISIQMMPRARGGVGWE